MLKRALIAFHLDWVEDGKLVDEVEDETGLKYLYKDIISDYFM